MTLPFQTASAFTLTAPAQGEVTSWRLHTDTGWQSGWRCGGAGESQANWLVLHGGPGSGASPRLLAPFAGLAVHAWAPSQRQCLPSPERPSAPLSVQRMVDDLEALRRACGVARWSVLAGSWGSYLALAYVARYPGSVQGLVLRGSFLGGRADIWGLVHKLPRALLRRVGLPAPTSATTLSSWLTRAAQVYQFGTRGANPNPLAHAWALAETRLALHGARRALRAMPPDGRLRVAQHAVVQGLCAGLRRSAAAARMGKPVAPALARKVAIQTRLLPRLLAQPVLRMAKPFQRWSAPRLALVHGQFDAVCQPRHSRQLLQAAQRAATDSAHVSLHGCLAGHLGNEPAIAQALRACIVGGNTR